MATNTDPQFNMDELRDLLSPYLDGEVTDSERAQVEHALHTSPELVAELESLRQTVTWLAELPAAAAPRPFTLTEADLRGSSPEARPKPSRWFSLPAWAAGLAAVAVIMIVALAAGGLLLSGPFGDSARAPAEIAMQQESAAPAVSEADVAASAPAEAESVEFEAAEPLAADAVEQPAEEGPHTAVVVEESAVEQEAEPALQPTVAPSVGLEKAAPEEQRVLSGAPADESERPLAAESLEEEARVEEPAADDAEDTAMMAAPAAGEEGGEAGAAGQLEPTGKSTAPPALELTPLAPETTAELEAEAIQRASATPISVDLVTATPMIADSSPTATEPALATPAPAAGEEGGEAGAAGQLEPTGKSTAPPALELTPLAPETTAELEAEAIQRASATPISVDLVTATPMIVDSSPTATEPALVTPAPTATTTPMPVPRTFGSRGVSLVLGALVVIIIAGVGLWLVSHRIKGR